MQRQLVRLLNYDEVMISRVISKRILGTRDFENIENRAISHSLWVHLSDSFSRYAFSQLTCSLCEILWIRIRTKSLRSALTNWRILNQMMMRIRVVLRNFQVSRRADRYDLQRAVSHALYMRLRFNYVKPNRCAWSGGKTYIECYFHEFPVENVFKRSSFFAWIKNTSQSVANRHLGLCIGSVSDFLPFFSASRLLTIGTTATYDVMTFCAVCKAKWIQRGKRLRMPICYRYHLLNEGISEVQIKYKEIHIPLRILYCWKILSFLHCFHCSENPLS